MCTCITLQDLSVRDSADIPPCGCQVERPGELQEVVGAQRLSDNVSSILERLEGELDKVDSRIGESMHVLDLDNDGLVRTCML